MTVVNHQKKKKTTEVRDMLINQIVYEYRSVY